jgi:hypothetical protein
MCCKTRRQRLVDLVSNCCRQRPSGGNAVHVRQLGHTAAGIYFSDPPSPMLVDQTDDQSLLAAAAPSQSAQSASRTAPMRWLVENGFRSPSAGFVH